MDRLNKDLEKIGLSEKEALVYLSALELGPTNIQNLTNKSGIKRSTVYEMIKKLESLSLMTQTTKGKRRLIVAAPPENLIRTLKEREKLLKEILPELKSINNTGFVKPKITFYDGREGLREIYMEALKSSTNNADWISPMKSILETVGVEWMEKYVELKVKLNYWIRSIHVSDLIIDDYRYQDPSTFKKTLRDVRFSPKGINIPNAIGIYDNKVAILSSRKEGFGFIIESEDFAQSMHELYSLLWNRSKTWEELDIEARSTDNEKPAVSK
jgi:HTH-type transcriptional regulator, sugar sensing transcriptional regulator